VFQQIALSGRQVIEDQGFRQPYPEGETQPEEHEQDPEQQPEPEERQARQAPGGQAAKKGSKHRQYSG